MDERTAEESRTGDQERRDAPPLDERDQRKADEQEDLNVSVTYEVIRRAGRDELRRPSAALAWSGLAAGLSMGFSMMTEAFIRARLPEATWTPLISKFGYTMGFLVVILGNQQLFTENTLTAVIPLLARRTRDALTNTLRLWGVVLASNLLGAFVFALILDIDWLFPGDAARAFADIADTALQLDTMRTFLLAIFAGWLIALMVWMLPAAKEMKPVVIILVTYVVGIGGFPHIIAGGVEAFYGGLQGSWGWGEVVGGYLVPTLLGNTIGGVTLVSGLAHAQVVAGGGNRRPSGGHSAAAR